MKKITLTIILIMSNIIIFAQCDESCLPEGITFETQEQIDNFQTNYPNWTEIEGDVEINGDDINNLNGLNVITAIGGSLLIDGNFSLITLSGLENLTTVEGNLSIGDYGYWIPVGNPLLINIEDLSGLTFVGGDLLFIANYALTSLNGLENVASVGGKL